MTSWTQSARGRRFTVAVAAVASLLGSSWSETALAASADASTPRMELDRPSSGDTITWPFRVSGWALDLAATAGTGVDAVHVWAFPSLGAAPVFLKAAELGIDRPEVGALFGPEFQTAGFRLVSRRFLSPGAYTFQVFARSTVSGTFNVARSVPVTIEASTFLRIDGPAEGSFVQVPFRVAGWTFSTGDPGGTGVDAVHVWASPADGSAPTVLGAAALGVDRPDVAAAIGKPNLGNTGYRLDVSTELPDGAYTLNVFARHTVTGTFDVVRSVNVHVGSAPRMSIGRPRPSEAVRIPFRVAGWAVDLGAPSGTGVDAVHVWAVPAGGSTPIFLGAAAYGIHRPGVETLYGDPRFAPSGFRLEVDRALLPGDYTLHVFARSTLRGTFNHSLSRPFTIAMPIALQPIVSGLASPVEIAHAGDASGRLFIALQNGRVMIHDGARLLPAPFLDISSLVSCCGERGLLGLAFHPDYFSNGYFYVNYTRAGTGGTVVARYQVSAGNPDVADPLSELVLLEVSQPFANHNGGALRFGPDGFLYVALGDGGSAGDPQNRAQNLSELLGKILRIDVDGAAPYAVPPDNPFVGRPGARGEIWAYGLRNPWRFSFDRASGDLFIGDVGQSSREEIDLQRSTSPGGENYGWRRMEGTACFNPAAGCNDGTLTLPILEYLHGAEECSVTGGYRYRGAAVPLWDGVYFYGDFCSGRIWGGFETPDGLWKAVPLLDTELLIASFGEDESGEIYVADLQGTVYRLVEPPPSGASATSIERQQEE